MSRLSVSRLTLGLTLCLGTGTATAGNDPFLGEVMFTAATFCPRGYAEADGTLLSISSYSALFSLLGTTYGGDGRTTFALPDLRGRVPLHEGAGPGLSNQRQGAEGGAETVTLSTDELPVMKVAVMRAGTGPASRSSGTSPAAVANRANTTPSANGTPQATTIGKGKAHANMPPYVVLRACIATQGTFPSRS